MPPLQVKYGLLAQSVLAPGFFTLASNVVTSSFRDIHPEMPRWGFYCSLSSWSYSWLSRWKKEYMATSHKVLLAETLSPTFVGLTFQVRSGE